MKRTLRWLALAAIAAGTVGLAPMGAHAYSNVARTIPGGGEIVRAVDPAQDGCSDDAVASGWGDDKASVNNPCDVRIFLDQPYNASSPTVGDDSFKMTVLLNGTDITDQGTIRGADISGDPTSPDLTLLPGNDTLIWTPAAALSDGDYKVHIEAAGVDDVNGARPPQCTVGSGEDERTINLGCYDLEFTIASTPAAPTVTSSLTPNRRDYVLAGTAEPGSVIEIKQDGQLVTKTVAECPRIDEVIPQDLDPLGLVDGPTFEGCTVADTNGVWQTTAIPWTSKSLPPLIKLAASSTFDVTATAAPRTTDERKGAVGRPAISLPTFSVTPTVTVANDLEAPILRVDSSDSSIQDPTNTLTTDELVGTAEDNLSVDHYTVVVKNAVSNSVMPASHYTVTTVGGVFGTWKVHFKDATPGKWILTVIAYDAHGNASDATDGTVSIVLTTGDAVSG